MSHWSLVIGHCSLVIGNELLYYLLVISDYCLGK